MSDIALETYKPKVLIVDDDSTTQMVLRASVTQWGFTVIQAYDGKEALSLLESNDPPAIVIADWVMPKLDGLTFCEQANRLFRPRPYIIIMTHNKGTVNLVKAIETGADEFIEKPINLAELRCRLLVATRILTDQYFKLNKKQE